MIVDEVVGIATTPETADTLGDLVALLHRRLELAAIFADADRQYARLVALTPTRTERLAA